MDINSGGDFARFNNLFVSPNGFNVGIGTYSNNWSFICGSASIFGTMSFGGCSASFVFEPRTITLSSNTNYTTGTNSVVYLTKSVATSYTLTIATPSFSGQYIIFRRIDTQTGNITLQTSSSGSNFLRKGATVSGFSTSFILASPTFSTKLIYIGNTWYEI
jgi:hypothetical protein